MREIPIPPPALDPAWLSGFRTSLELADLAPATVAGYLKDVRQFLSWHAHEGEFPALSELELIAYRHHLIGERRLRPATVNRRLEALRRRLAPASLASTCR